MRKLLVILLSVLNTCLFAQNTGIGTATPDMKLHISSPSDTALLQIDNNTALANNTNVGMYFKNGAYFTGAIKTTGTGSNVARLGFYTFAVADQNQLLERLSILDNGNVGIGTINPITKLEINGQLRITGGSPGANKVLTSDASGTASWQNLSSAGAWSLTGNAGTTSANFLGTTDNNPLFFRVNNIKAGQINPAEQALSLGFQSLLNNTFARRNIAFGDNALKTQSFANGNVAYSSLNIAIGDSALYTNNPSFFGDGINNIAIGHNALNKNTTGRFSIAIGNNALYSLNTTTAGGIAIGHDALYSNTTGIGNLAIGNSALRDNTSGRFNLGIGGSSLALNTTGWYNTGIGDAALISNTTGFHNTAVGYHAMSENTTASHNLALGNHTLKNQNFSNGGTNWNSFNIAIGDSALYTNNPSFFGDGINNIAIGHNALNKNTTGRFSIAIGNNALYSLNTTTAGGIAIGHDALYSNTTGIGNLAIGNSALRDNTSGRFNLGIGGSSLALNTTGWYNTGIGDAALISNTTGFHNTAVGYNAMSENTTASHNLALGNHTLKNQNFSNGGANWNSYNIAIGDSVLYNNNPTSVSNGFGNTAAGHLAMLDNTTGFQNTVFGYSAMANNTTGRYNTIVGADAFELATSGSFNTAMGRAALGNSTAATDNTAIGYGTLFNATGSGNTALGISAGDAVTTGTFNTFIGRNTDIGIGASGITNATAIGNEASVNASNTMVFGNSIVNKWGFGINTAAANILEFNNAVTTARLTVGGVWTNASDKKIKTNFSLVDKKEVLNHIMQLPVTRWSYIREGNNVTHIGPMAQDFYRLFKTGGDDKTISSIDPSGVALIGIQQLKNEVDELKAEIVRLKKIIADLK